MNLVNDLVRFAFISQKDPTLFLYFSKKAALVKMKSLSFTKRKGEKYIYSDQGDGPSVFRSSFSGTLPAGKRRTHSQVMFHLRLDGRYLKMQRESVVRQWPTLKKIFPKSYPPIPL